MLAGIFGAKYDDLTYLKSNEKLPAVKNNTLDLLDLIEETWNIQEDFWETLEDLHTPRLIFNQDTKLKLIEIPEEEENKTKTLLENGGTTPLLNQFPSKYSLPIGNSDAWESPPPGVCEDASDAAHLESVGNLSGKILRDSGYNIFGVYQYWVHQNPVTHMYFRIEEDGKWQERWENWLVLPPKTMTYHLDGSEIDLLKLFLWNLTEFVIANETQRGW